MVYIRDMTVLRENHPASPYNSPLFIEFDGVPQAAKLKVEKPVYCVGWLGTKRFLRKIVKDEVIIALFEIRSSEVFFDGTRGVHTCQVCHETCPQVQWHYSKFQLTGHGHYLIEHEERIFMFPELILHYILDHQYCPPSEFQEAVIDGELLGPRHFIQAD